MVKRIKNIFCCFITLILIGVIFSCNKSENIKDETSSILLKLKEQNEILKINDDNIELKKLEKENSYNDNEKISHKEDFIRENNNFDYVLETPQGLYYHESRITKEVDDRWKAKFEEIENDRKIQLSRKIYEIENSKELELQQEIEEIENSKELELQQKIEEIENSKKLEIEKFKKSYQVECNKELQKAIDNFVKNEKKNIEDSISKKLNLRMRVIKIITILIFIIVFVLIIIQTMVKVIIPIIKEKNKQKNQKEAVDKIIKTYESQFFEQLKASEKTISELSEGVRKSKDNCQIVAFLNVLNEFKQYELAERINIIERDVNNFYAQIDMQFTKLKMCNPKDKIELKSILDPLFSLGSNISEKCYEVYLNAKNMNDKNDSFNFLSNQQNKLRDESKRLSVFIGKKGAETSEFEDKVQSVIDWYEKQAEIIQNHAKELEPENNN